jgi:hypothetical protein
MMKKTTLIACAAALAASTAFAGPVDSGYYAGVSLGSVTGDLSKSTTYSNALSSFGGEQSNTNTTNVFGGNLFFGYNINTYVGVEVGYLSVGKLKYVGNAVNTAYPTTDETTTASYSLSQSTTGFDTMVVGHLPFTLFAPTLQGWSAYAKLGAAMLNASSTLDINSVTTLNTTGEPTGIPTNLSNTQTTKGTVFAYGLGVDYALPMVQGLHVSLDYLSTASYENNSTTNYGYIPAMQMIGLGANYRF